MKQLGRALAIGALLALAVVPALPSLSHVQAVTCPPGVPDCNPEPIAPDEGAAYRILNNVITIMFYALMLLAVIFILVAAFNYLTAAGNPEKVEKAQQQLLYAVIAIVIAVLARSVPYIVTNFVKQNVR